MRVGPGPSSVRRHMLILSATLSKAVHSVAEVAGGFGEVSHVFRWRLGPLDLDWTLADVQRGST